MHGALFFVKVNSLHAATLLSMDKIKVETDLIILFQIFKNIDKNNYFKVFWFSSFIL